ncbi:MAG: Hsp20/alpha crystallin family protein [Anaerolineales bacterium]|jgi:HSP20 family protein|nr:Hsp20/alpha crystallin family protein [Anaerolineales bacterium]
MVKLTLKSDPKRSSYYVLSDIRNLNSEIMNPRQSMRSHVWRPPIDVFETDLAIVVRVEIAGVQESDFVITLDERHLSIRGTRPDLPERRAYQQMEIRFGEFSAEVDLHTQVNVEEVEAIYSNGFLRVTLPKARPHQIRID